MNIKLSDRQIGLLFLLLIIPVYAYNLDEAPLYMEEPRRAMVALEMDLQNNYWVPTIGGEYYYHKTPFFNWVLLVAYNIAGDYSETAGRMVSVVSFMLMGLLTYGLVRKYVNEKTGIAAGLLFVVSADILFYFSTMAGIDLFYSLISFASMILIYHYYKQQQYALLFIITYGLAGIGFLTKGFPSVVFMGFSVPAFLFWQKDLKRLFSWHHFAGIFVFLFIVVGYFYIYSTYNDIYKFFEGLWGQSYERTIFEHDLDYIVKNILYFPVDFLIVAMPASALMVYFVKHKGLQYIKSNSFTFFCLIIFAANIWIYWISPGTRSRYIYMLVPFFTIIVTYQYFYAESKKWQRNFILGFTQFIIIAGIIASVGTMFVPELYNYVDGYAWQVVFAAILLIVAGIYYNQYRLLYKKNTIAWPRMQQSTVYALVFAMIIFRFVFAATVLPARGTTGNSVVRLNHAREICDITENQPLHFYKDTRAALTTHFYIEKWRNQIVNHTDSIRQGHYYLISSKYYDPDKMKIIKEIDDTDHSMLLISSKHNMHE